jgi:DNA polymerase-3 subunit delta
MKLYANQLATQLNKGLQPCYLLFGDEPFQIDDSRRQIKHIAKQSGVEEFIRLSDDDQFDWNELTEHCQMMSLFASKKLIELELSSGKIPKQGSDILQQIAPQLSDETILVIFGPKLEQSQTRAKWFKTLDALGCYVPVYEIEGQHLNRWLQQQLQQRQLVMSADAQAFLLTLTAGNLLACSQELEKITLATNSHRIELSDIQDLVADQSRFSAFQFIDKLWAGDANACLTILQRLKLEELEPNILLWALQKDVVMLQQVQQAQLFNLDTKAVFDKHRVWKNKQQQFLRLTQNVTPEQLNKALEMLSDIDKALKHTSVPCPYTLFAHIVVLLTQGNSVIELPLPLVESDA